MCGPRKSETGERGWRNDAFGEAENFENEAHQLRVRERLERAAIGCVRSVGEMRGAKPDDEVMLVGKSPELQTRCRRGFDHAGKLNVRGQIEFARSRERVGL